MKRSATTANFEVNQPVREMVDEYARTDVDKVDKRANVDQGNSSIIISASRLVTVQNWATVHKLPLSTIIIRSSTAATTTATTSSSANVIPMVPNAMEHEGNFENSNMNSSEVDFLLSGLSLGDSLDEKQAND